MNIAKNMESIFVAILFVAGATTLATAAVPKFHAAPVASSAASSVASSVAASADSVVMHTVYVSAKRL